MILHGREEGMEITQGSASEIAGEDPEGRGEGTTISRRGRADGEEHNVMHCLLHFLHVAWCPGMYHGVPVPGITRRLGLESAYHASPRCKLQVIDQN